MASDLLLEIFEQIVNQAGDISRLNEAILQLAVQGKLVAQDPNDEPASELLKRITAEKKRLGVKGKPLPKIGEEERPYPLPDSWEWVHLGIVGDWGSGATPSRSNPEFWGGSIPWLKTGELNDGYISKSEEKITGLALQKTSVRLNKPGDVLIAMYGATIGKLGILEIEATTNQACCACTPFPGVFNLYLFYFLLAMREDFRAQGAGGAQPNISKQKIVNTLIPLPPLAEQKRIVERIDTLLVQTRELGNHLTQAEASLAVLHDTTINTLLAAADPDDFASRWQFIADNFNLLYDENYPEAALANVAALKQTILQLAVQGKLTRQDPTDEPASELLKRIAAEKKRLGIKSRELAEIGEEERPYTLPVGWEWIRLGNLSTSIQTGPFGSALHKADYVTNGIPVINPANIQNEKFIPSHTMMINEQTQKRLSNYILQEGDIVMGRRGEMGRCALVTREEDGWLCGTGSLILRFSEDVYKPFVVKLISSAQVKSYLLGSSVGSTMNNLNHRILNNLVIGIPPFAEQKRIVARVYALLHLCDELATHIMAAQATHTALRDTALVRIWN